MREAIERHGATLVYLPPYSPDLNPIEQAFAKLKALLRKIAARTLARLWDAVGDQLDRFTPQECVNYLANAGYVPLVRDTALEGEGPPSQVSCLAAYSLFSRTIP